MGSDYAGAIKLGLLFPDRDVLESQGANLANYRTPNRTKNLRYVHSEQTNTCAKTGKLAAGSRISNRYPLPLSP